MGDSEPLVATVAGLHTIVARIYVGSAGSFTAQLSSEVTGTLTANSGADISQQPDSNATSQQWRVVDPYFGIVYGTDGAAPSFNHLVHAGAVAVDEAVRFDLSRGFDPTDDYLRDMWKGNDFGAESPGSGGEPLDVRRGELAGPLEDALFGAQEGKVVGPIETEHGFHVARLESVIPQFVAPYEDVRTVIEEDLLVAARERAFDEWLDGRRQELATIEPQFEHPAHPIHGIPSHRH